MALSDKEKDLLHFFTDYGINIMDPLIHGKGITEDTLKKATDCGYDWNYLINALHHLEEEGYIRRINVEISGKTVKYSTTDKTRKELKTTDDEKEMERFSFQMECRATCTVLCTLPKGTTPEQAESYIMSHDMKEFLDRKEVRVLDKMKRIPGKEKIMKGTVINLDA